MRQKLQNEAEIVPDPLFLFVAHWFWTLIHSIYSLCNGSCLTLVLFTIIPRKRLWHVRLTLYSIVSKNKAHLLNLFIQKSQDVFQTSSMAHSIPPECPNLFYKPKLFIISSLVCLEMTINETRIARFKKRSGRSEKWRSTFWTMCHRKVLERRRRKSSVHRFDLFVAYDSGHLFNLFSPGSRPA